MAFKKEIIIAGASVFVCKINDIWKIKAHNSIVWQTGLLQMKSSQILSLLKAFYSSKGNLKGTKSNIFAESYKFTRVLLKKYIVNDELIKCK